MSVVFEELKKYWIAVLLLFATVLISTGTTMALPYFFMNLIDLAIPDGNESEVFFYTGLMLVCVIIQILAGLATARLSAHISMSVSRNLRQRVFDKVIGFSQEEIDHFTTSSLITRTNTDIQSIQFFLSLSLAAAFTAPFMCIIGTVLALMTSPELSSVLVVSIPVLVIVLIIIGKVAIPLSTQIQTKLDRINLIIREKLTGTRVIRAFCTEKFERDRFDEANQDYKGLNSKMQYITVLLLPVITLILAVTIALIIFLACSEYKAGESGYSTGMLISIITYVIYILGAISVLSVIMLLFPRAAACANRTKEVVTSHSRIKEAEKPKRAIPEERGCVEFKDVSFRYRGAEKDAVHKLSFKSRPGETTAIIGGTGDGKSSIINMIPRLYDCTEGEILVDGVNVKDYKLDDLRSKIGFVPQKAFLFKGTIDSNIAFGADNPTELAVEEAVKVAQSYDFVMGKEDGFETPVAQGGSNFSGGQKQRLCIARSIVRSPEIYIFDDSFSALDFKTDKELRAALKEKTGDDATTIIVAQRVSTIAEADRIIVINKGNIEGIGTHDELLESCDIYKEIVISQMSNGEEA